jgi:putative membrane-bound dehydrogenase-like protein
MRTLAYPHRHVALAFLSLFVFISPAGAEDLGLRVAPGFRVTLYADQDLANDIFAMTLDSHGRVVVTGPGYIKVLHDTKGTGKAEKATLFATPPTGGMGLCFDGTDLYFCGGGWLSRYRDPSGKGRADGPPEHLLPLAYSEHGGHAMRKGPDGWWYVIGGNDSHFGPQHQTLPRSPIKNPEGGALLRLTPDCRQCEVIAQGFRNPYDFDFNEAGDLFTYDSDCERDFFLPWYTPTRIYHIGHAGHHGWRLSGYLRSWCRKDYYLDTVDILYPVGRGSPTGVVCYRHDQFPEHYRGGLFALDWTFGKVYFFPLEPVGSSYRTQPEVFLEAVGTSGFDPTDVVVAPDGSLFICQGGRGTRGAVYHVEYVGDKGKITGPASELDTVLYAQQPLDAWSRARWMPLAKKLGPGPFRQVILDEKRDEGARLRAIEIMTELFGGLPKDMAEKAADSISPLVRSRVAWSLGRVPCKDIDFLLGRLATLDTHPRVKLAALDALGDRYDPKSHLGSSGLRSGSTCSDKRVRQATARLMALEDSEAPERIGFDGRDRPADASQLQFINVLAKCWHYPQKAIPQHILERVVALFEDTANTELRLQAVRLIMLALGDYCLADPPVEVYTAYSFPPPRPDPRLDIKSILTAVREGFPSGNSRLDEEESRLLAMLEDDDASTPGKVASFWTQKSSPTQDMHYLVVFSRLRAPRDSVLTAQTANALLGLHRKLEGREQRTKQTWNERIAELTGQLLRHDPRLADELLRHPDFVNAAHVAVAASLDPEHRKQAAKLFLAAVQKDPEFAWSGPLIDLLTQLPAKQVRPVLRAQWSDFGLCDAIVLYLAQSPEAADRGRFLWGLDSAQQQIVQASLSALKRLPRDETPKNLVPLLRLLRRLEQEPKSAALRGQVLSLLSRQSGRLFDVNERAINAAALKRSYQPVFDWFEQHYPALVAVLNDTGDEDPAVWNKLLKAVDWTKGNAARGEVLFRARACQTCHGGARALGPDLTGVATRFSRDDLFTAIIYPSRDVAPAYRTTTVETRTGQLVTGIIAFESADGLILQTGATTTVRLATPDIVSRVPSNRSLMPNGLLKDLKPTDLADLYTYLQSLKPKTATSSAPK